MFFAGERKTCFAATAIDWTRCQRLGRGRKPAVGVAVKAGSLILNTLAGTSGSRIEFRRGKRRSGRGDGDGPVIDV